MEERTVNLKHSGDVQLAIIRLRDRETPAMEFLEHAVRTIEELVGVPLPTNYIALYFDNATSSPTTNGTNYRTHITMLPGYDEERSRKWKRAPHLTAHEFTHYYFGGANQAWIDEGTAEVLATISENVRVGSQIAPDNEPCNLFQTISEIEKLESGNKIERRTDEYRCYYSLGERLFLDLYRTLDEETFRQGLGNLHLKSLRDAPDDDCEGTLLNICHLVAAFKSDVPDETAAEVDRIVRRWYGAIP